jgi:hypothetical protein
MYRRLIYTIINASPVYAVSYVKKDGHYKEGAVNGNSGNDPQTGAEGKGLF